MAAAKEKLQTKIVLKERNACVAEISHDADGVLLRQTSYIEKSVS